MALAIRCQPASSVAFKRSPVKVAGPRRPLIVRAEGNGFDRATGYIAEDNSGRANIYPTKQQAYLKSSTSDAAARQGLGGLQGGILVGFIIAAVAVITLAGAKAPGPETLQTVGEAFAGDSLTVIAERIKASL